MKIWMILLVIVMACGVVKGGTAKTPKARSATKTTKTTVRGENGGVKGGAITVKPAAKLEK